MTKSVDLQNILSEVYGLNATPIDKIEHFDLSEVTVDTRFPDNHTTENYGKFGMQQFQAGPDELYNLIICENDFTSNEHLFDAMQNEERRYVKDYELVDQNKTMDGYFLYRLIPYMVQRKPAWY
jgi:hypothetical protein